MISEATKKMIADKHYNDFKEEMMDLVSIPEMQISDRIIAMCNDMYNEPHCDDAFDDGREIIEIMELKWVHEQFKNISGFNTPEFLSKYETKSVADLRVKMHGDNEYARGFEDAARTWERQFANMSAYEFSEWKLKHRDIIVNDCPKELQKDCPCDVCTCQDPTPEEEFAWKEMEKAIKRGDK